MSDAQLIFERSAPGRGTHILPPRDVPIEELPQELLRATAPRLPEIAEGEISRHYTWLAKRSRGVNDGFYPLGSCTMKYNPKVNERIARMPAFAGVHPLADEKYAQGCLEAMFMAQDMLCGITGMDAFSLSPAAGAHGEFAGMLMIKAWHAQRGDVKRTKVLIPDSAHGTNPATAAMTGFTVVNIPSDSSGRVDIDELRKACGPDVAGLMLTNPNTLGLFERDILDITRAVHEAGGLCYYDGANLNAVMGITRPGDMAFDVGHLNLHKTCGAPHGGGGPGAGPVGCKEFLRAYLPAGAVTKGEDSLYRLAEQQEHSIGRVRGFHCSFLVCLKALCYMLSLGGGGLREASETAVINANYMMKALEKHFDVPFAGTCMHEFVLSLDGFKKATEISALDIAKGLLDMGIHPPTMYFPLIVKEALMIEPTETETRETLDGAAAAFLKLKALAETEPQALHDAPVTTPVGRLDEAMAARNPVLRHVWNGDA